MIETPQNLCNSIMENDCLLVKMLNENPLHNIRYQDVSIEKNSKTKLFFYNKIPQI